LTFSYFQPDITRGSRYSSLSSLTPGTKRTRIQNLEMEDEFSLQQFIIDSGSISNDESELSELCNDFSAQTFNNEDSFFGGIRKRRNLGESQNPESSRLQPVEILSDY
jgi:hypothetical protein